MAEAYIIDAVRTPIGRKKGSLAEVHPLSYLFSASLIFLGVKHRKLSLL